jgi:hypothetical protein
MPLYCIDVATISLTIETAQRGSWPSSPNPTTRLFHTERSDSGMRHVWVGKRVNVMIDRRTLGAGVSWLALGRIG